MEAAVESLSKIYLWTGVGALIVAVLFVFLLRNKQKTSALVVFVVTMVLFAFKSTEAIYWLFVDIGEIKLVEFSYFAYYLVPLLILFGHPRTRFAAGFYAFAIGVGYVVGMLMNPAGMLSTHKDLTFLYYSAFRGIFQHLILFFIGTMTLLNISKFKMKDVIPLFIILAFVTGWMYLVKFGIIYPEGYSGTSMGVFIVDGSLATWIFGEDIQLWHRILVLGIILVLVVGICFAAVALNNLIFKSKKARGKIEYDELPLVEDYGIIPFIARGKKKKPYDWSI